MSDKRDQQITKFEMLLPALDETIKCLDRTENYNKYCNEKLKECDKALNDLDHYLELGALDAIKLTKVATMRKGWLLDRRFYKDEIERLSTIRDEGHAAIKTLKEIRRGYIEIVKRHEDRHYVPRVLNELFEELENGAKILQIMNTPQLHHKHKKRRKSA